METNIPQEQVTEPHPGGRPLKFATVAELQIKIDAYFREMKEFLYVNADGIPVYEPLTITGLALALDTSRKVLMEYEGRDEFSNAIKTAKTRIENFAEKRLFGSTPTGAIFALKNFGWKDESQVKQTINDLRTTLDMIDGQTAGLPPKKES